MKRKKSTQLLAVALTAAMLAQPVGAQMVFAEGNTDAVQQEQAVRVVWSGSIIVKVRQ